MFVYNYLFCESIRNYKKWDEINQTNKAKNKESDYNF